MQQNSKSQSATAHSQATTQHIGIGEYEVTTTGDELVTYGLGSCVGVVLFDETAGIAGLAHIKLPTAAGQQATADAQYADTGIRAMYSEMQSFGATPHHTVANVVGGIDMEDDSSAVGSGIGTRNINQAKDTLAGLNIRVAGTDVGGDTVRSIYVDSASQEVNIETACGRRYRLVPS